MSRLHALRAACAIGSVLAAPGQALSGSAPCALHARVSDPDPAGTNVRAGPSPHAPIVARLPHGHALAGDSIAPELDIVGFDHGWAKVRGIRFADYGEGETMLFAGTGWISGRLLSATLTGMPTPVQGKALRNASAALDGAVIETIDDCSGPLAHVTARLSSGERVSGWTAGLCANQVTTCS